MAKVSVKVNYPTPDIKATEEEIHKEMSKFTINTLQTWVLETVAPIPVWSGAARASFLFLAAKALTSITINPIAPDPPGSRITLGITEAAAEVIAEKGKKYGWEWASDLAHIGVVQERVKFVEAGLDAIKDKTPTLPQPETKPVKGV
jgi:hypothetical protein